MSQKTPNLTSKVSTIEGIAFSKMRPSPAAQRELRAHRVAELLADFDTEMLGFPVVNLREGVYWIIDGYHRVETTKAWLEKSGTDWKGQKLDCRVYTGLSAAQEAHMYLKLNNQLPQSAYDKFNAAVNAGWQHQVATKRAIEAAGLRITKDAREGSFRAVATALKIYKRSTAATLERALRIAYESFGLPGLTNHVIDGVARLVERYGSLLQDKPAIAKLQMVRAGVGSLTTKATSYRKTTGNQLPYCFAAALVDALNAGEPPKKKLPAWWKEQQ